MSRTAEEIGMIAGGIGIALLGVLAGPIAIFGSMAINNALIGVGLTTTLGGALGLLNPVPNTPSGIGSQGQLPIEIPNPLWRIVYGIFQYSGAITFEDAPILDWTGTQNGTACQNQYVQRVHTLTAHQIAGFLAVVIDGQTYNFGTDLVLITSSNYQGGRFPIGMWGFTNQANPWTGQIYFAFDPGDPGYGAQPFPLLEAGATIPTPLNPSIVVGSSRWTSSCFQRGRAKVQVLLQYQPSNQIEEYGPSGGSPQPYVLGSGRIPNIEFKIAGRLVLDPRIVTAWQPLTEYPQWSYILTPPNSFGVQAIWINQTAGTSGSTSPAFSGLTSETDGGCLWANGGSPVFVAGSGKTSLNNPGSNKLGGPGGAILIADAWQGGVALLGKQVIEAPIGYFQQSQSGFTPGATRPTFSTTLGGSTSDNGGTWRCLGRSPYATCLPDDDGTQNQGGFANPALVIADYLQTPRNLFGLGAVLTADSIETVIAAANICDEPVVIEYFPSDGTSLSERSFAANGCFESTSAYGDVLKSLALSMAGFVVPPGDCWRIYAGSYVPPEVTLGDGDVRGAIKGDFRLSARDTCNGVKGQYIPSFLPINTAGPLASSPASPAWKKTDFPPVQSAAYIAEDGGIIIWKDITLDFTISLWMAQRIASIVLEQLRRQVTVSLPAKVSALQLGAGQTVNFSHARWASITPPLPTVFQIAHTSLRTDKSNDVPTIGVDLVLRQTDASVYEFEAPSATSQYGDYSPYGVTGVGAGNVE